MTTTSFDGMTAAQIVAAMTAEPAWDFAANPWNAVGHASSRGAQAHLEGRLDSERLWAEVRAALVTAAANPKVY